ncbi:MAG: hypothetical protein KKA28_07790 [Planctomycetes bacterium]|nr:hypothetical protein [Planctomycetota bacterium]MCG2682001.1 hypothetical protein [Planctomycetales bacterium]
MIWAAWTVCCVLVMRAALDEVDAEKMKPGFDILEKLKPRAVIEKSRSNVYWLSFIAWGAGSGAIGGVAMMFWKARYHIDYQGNVVEIFHSWPKKQLFVNSELQDENTDFSFSRVELHGRIKSGEGAGRQVRVSFASFGTLTPVCVVIDDAVVFKG